MTRKALLALALIGAMLPATSASAQTVLPLPGGPSILPFEPKLTPLPDTVSPKIEQFDCRTYWIHSSEPPHRYEQQTVCFGFRILP
jgi:hypothetical protein